MARLPIVIAGLALSIGLSACCTERTVTFYRGSTAEAPALPARTGVRLRAGEVQVAGELNPLLLKDIKTYTDDRNSAPAMWIPRLQVGGQIYGAINDVVEVGGHLRGASAEWSSPTTTNALEPRLKNQFILQGGWSVRINFSSPEQALQVSLLAEADLVLRQSILIEESFCSSGAYCRNHSCQESIKDTDESHDKNVRVNLMAGLNGSWEMVRHLHLLGIVALSLRGTNRYSSTVTYNPTEETQPSDNSWSPKVFLNLGGGFELRFRHFFANAIIHYPVSFVRSLRYGPALAAGTGVIF